MSDVSTQVFIFKEENAEEIIKEFVGKKCHRKFRFGIAIDYLNYLLGRELHLPILTNYTVIRMTYVDISDLNWCDIFFLETFSIPFKNLR